MNQTVQRSALIAELQQSGAHLTAGELYSRLRDKVPQISMGTIYRNLEELAAHGVIGKLELTGHPKCFEARTGSHYHSRCRVCGALSDLPEEVTAELARFFAGLLPAYGCDSFKIEFDGCCRDCEAQFGVSDARKQNHKRGAP